MQNFMNQPAITPNVVNPNTPQDQQKAGSRGYADVTIENAYVAGIVTFYPNQNPKHQSARFTVAVNEDYVNADGQVVNQAQFISVQAWGKTADVACFFCEKGKKVNLQGTIKNFNRVRGILPNGKADTVTETTISINRLTLLNDSMSSTAANATKNTVKVLGQIAAEGIFHPNNIQTIAERVVGRMFTKKNRIPMTPYNPMISSQTGKHGPYGYVWTKDYKYWFEALGFGKAGSDLYRQESGKPTLAQPQVPAQNLGSPQMAQGPVMVGGVQQGVVQSPVQPQVVQPDVVAQEVAQQDGKAVKDEPADPFAG